MSGARSRPGDAGVLARERLAQYGADALTDNELLSIVLGAAGRTAADAVLAEYGSLQQLSRETADDLARIDGLTPRRAERIVAAVELGRRTLIRPAPPPRQVATYLLPIYGSHPVERFGIISLSTKHHILRTVLISTGTLDASLVHPREVFRTAAMHRAAAIVLFHNHPSGDPTPSSDDVALTARLCEAGVLFGIEVVDHVILADAKYCSFKEMGRL